MSRFVRYFLSTVHFKMAWSYDFGLRGRPHHLESQRETEADPGAGRLARRSFTRHPCASRNHRRNAGPAGGGTLGDRHHQLEPRTPVGQALAQPTFDRAPRWTDLLGAFQFGQQRPALRLRAAQPFNDCRDLSRTGGEGSVIRACSRSTATWCSQRPMTDQPIARSSRLLRRSRRRFRSSLGSQ